MNKLLKRIRAAATVGLTWAIGWAPIGLLLGVVFGGNRVIPDEFPIDDWVMPLAALGFVGGAIFSSVLRIAEGKRGFEELSVPRFAVWGACGGAALGGLAILRWLVDAGFGPVIWPQAPMIVVATTILSAGSAAGTLALARKAKDQGSLLEEPQETPRGSLPSER